jgi:hypothetical protein
VSCFPVDGPAFCRPYPRGGVHGQAPHSSFLLHAPFHCPSLSFSLSLLPFSLLIQRTPRCRARCGGNRTAPPSIRPIRAHDRMLGTCDASEGQHGACPLGNRGERERERGSTDWTAMYVCVPVCYVFRQACQRIPSVLRLSRPPRRGGVVVVCQSPPHALSANRFAPLRIIALTRPPFAFRPKDRSLVCHTEQHVWTWGICY